LGLAPPYGSSWDEQAILSSALTVAATLGADRQLLDDIEHALAGARHPAGAATRACPCSSVSL